MPIVLLALLAVHGRRHGKASAKRLRNAMKRTVQAADIADIRVSADHATDAELRQSYEHTDFIRPCVDQIHSFVQAQMYDGLPRNPEWLLVAVQFTTPAYL
jgi:hypothetical protein